MKENLGDCSQHAHSRLYCPECHAADRPHLPGCKCEKVRISATARLPHRNAPAKVWAKFNRKFVDQVDLEKALVAKAACEKKSDAKHWSVYGTGRKLGQRSIKEKMLRLLERDGPLCHWCQRKTDPGLRSSSRLYPTLDHVVRRADGGSNDMSNLVIACRRCNNERHKPS